MKFKIREAAQDMELCKLCMWDLPFPTLDALKKGSEQVFSYTMEQDKTVPQ